MGGEMPGTRLCAKTAKSNLVLVGVDKNGEDITQGVILERLTICPTHCPKNSVLIKP
jgi:hypothetical protein